MPDDPQEYFLACRERHERRRIAAACYAEELLQWCHDNQINVSASKDKNAWKFRKGDAIARWTASSAHLSVSPNVRTIKFKHGKAHDWLQVKEVLSLCF